MVVRESNVSYIPSHAFYVSSSLQYSSGVSIFQQFGRYAGPDYDIIYCDTFIATRVISCNH